MLRKCRSLAMGHNRPAQKYRWHIAAYHKVVAEASALHQRSVKDVGVGRGAQEVIDVIACCRSGWARGSWILGMGRRVCSLADHEAAGHQYESMHGPILCNRLQAGTIRDIPASCISQHVTCLRARPAPVAGCLLRELTADGMCIGGSQERHVGCVSKSGRFWVVGTATGRVLDHLRMHIALSADGGNALVSRARPHCKCSTGTSWRLRGSPH